MSTFSKPLTQCALQTHTWAHQLTFHAKCTSTTKTLHISPKSDSCSQQVYSGTRNTMNWKTQTSCNIENCIYHALPYPLFLHKLVTHCKKMKSMYVRHLFTVCIVIPNKYISNAAMFYDSSVLQFLWCYRMCINAFQFTNSNSTYYQSTTECLQVYKICCSCTELCWWCTLTETGTHGFQKK